MPEYGQDYGTDYDPTIEPSPIPYQEQTPPPASAPQVQVITGPGAGISTNIPTPVGAGEPVPPPGLPYISSGGLFGSNYWPRWANILTGALPYGIGPAWTAARGIYNLSDRIRWALSQPRYGAAPGAAPARRAPVAAAGGGGGGAVSTPRQYGPGWYSPDYLRSIGYEPGQGAGSMWPGAGPSLGAYDVGGYGVGGGGGSFFHQLQGGRATPIAGSTYNLGASGPVNLSGLPQLSRGLWGAKQPLTPTNFNNMLGFMNYQGNATGLSGPAFGGLNYNQYLNLWNQLRQAGRTDPTTASGLAAGGGAEGGRNITTGGSRGVPPHQTYQSGGVVTSPGPFYLGQRNPDYAIWQSAPQLPEPSSIQPGPFYLGRRNPNYPAIYQSAPQLPAPVPAIQQPPFAQKGPFYLGQRNPNYQPFGGGYFPTTPDAQLMPRPAGPGGFFPTTPDAQLMPRPLGLQQSPQQIASFQGGGIAGGIRFGPYAPQVSYRPPDLTGFGEAYDEGRRRRKKKEDDEAAKAAQDQPQPAPLPSYLPRLPTAVDRNPITFSYNPYLGGYQRDPNIYPANYQLGGIAPMVPMMPPMQPGSTDTVPAMLTPKEMILTERQQGAVQPIPGKAKLLRADQRAALKKHRSRGY